MGNSTKPKYVIGYPLPDGEHRCDLPLEKETKPQPAPAAATTTTNERTNCCSQFDNSTVEFLVLLSIFMVLSGIVIAMIGLDRSDAFPIPIKIRLETFSVSSLHLNLSEPCPSIVTANWSISFSGKNVNWNLTKSLEEVKAIVLYRGAFVCDADMAPLQLRAGQDGAWRVNLTSAAGDERVESWVVKNIAADRIRDNVVVFDFRLEGVDVRSSKKKRKLMYRCDQMRLGFAGNSSSANGSLLDYPTAAILQ